MKKYLQWICVLIILTSSMTVKSQYNMVPNPSFEIYDSCPDYAGQVYHAIPWTNPTNASPDYFNSCTNLIWASVPLNYFGMESARTGNAYCGVIITRREPTHIFNNYREYLQVQLIDTLKSGILYCIQLYISTCDSSNYVTNNIGVYFSQSQIYIPNLNVLPFTPQFENPVTNNLNNRVGWTEITGTYLATGGEQFIVIGNFRDTTTSIDSFTGWGNPLTKYGMYYIDDVLITPCDSLLGVNDPQIVNPEINIFPKTTSDEIQIKSNEEIGEIFFYSTLGELVLHMKARSNECNININKLSKGVYFIRTIDLKNRQFIFKIIKI